jgi:hypothetical protein
MQDTGSVNQQRGTEGVFSLDARWLRARRSSDGTQRQRRTSHHQPPVARAILGVAWVRVNYVELLTPLGK